MPPKQLVQLLRSQIIPWTAPGARSGIIVARPMMQKSQLPEGAALTIRELRGERKILKARRKHGNHRLYTATWPKDNLQETTVPRISCIVSGIADHLLGKYSVRCGEGNFLIIPPGEPHQQFGPFLDGQMLKNGHCVLVHAYAYNHGILFWLTTSNRNEHVNNMKDNYLIPNMAAVQVLHLLVEEAANNGAGMESICKNYLSALFALIARDIETGDYMHPGPKENIDVSSRPPASFAEEVQKYIEANCHKILKVDDAAMHLYMSNSQFSRRMRQETGMTFLQLLTRVRIERAQQMLRETDLTVIAIANYLSFKSSTHFQALFRTHVECTPIEYRTRARKKTAEIHSL
jgi:AraC-like DNA-binding protein